MLPGATTWFPKLLTEKSLAFVPLKVGSEIYRVSAPVLVNFIALSWPRSLISLLVYPAGSVMLISATVAELTTVPSPPPVPVAVNL